MNAKPSQMTNSELESILPDVRGILTKLTESKEFTEYESKLDTATTNAIKELNNIIFLLGSSFFYIFCLTF